MLKIRLMRIGAKKRPFYRVVAVDERSKRNGAYVELLGTYNPLTEPKEIKLKQDRIDHWIKQGAQPSDGFLRIIGKAPQRPARKPKKAASVKDSGEPMEKKEATVDSGQAKQEAPVEAGVVDAETSNEGEVKPESSETVISSESEKSLDDKNQEEPVVESEEKEDERPT